MGNGPSVDQFHIDSSSPYVPRYAFAPTNFREMNQRTMSAITDRTVGQAFDMSLGGVLDTVFDGRFISSFPGETRFMDNEDGFFYHIIGVSRAGDISVAAP